MKRMLLLLAAFTLSACTTLPTYVHGDQHNSAYHYTYTTSAGLPSVPGEVGAVATSRTKCTLYAPPELGRVPSTPLTEYSQIKPHEMEKRTELLLRHIESLLIYIVDTRKAHIEAFRLYSANCMVAG